MFPLRLVISGTEHVGKHSPVRILSRQAGEIRSWCRCQHNFLLPSIEILNPPEFQQASGNVGALSKTNKG